jgi:hypothetical protein
MQALPLTKKKKLYFLGRPIWAYLAHFDSYYTAMHILVEFSVNLNNETRKGQTTKN